MRGPGSRTRAPVLRSRSGRGSRGGAKTCPVALVLPRSSFSPSSADSRMRDGARGAAILRSCRVSSLRERAQRGERWHLFAYNKARVSASFDSGKEN
jgi:hypothetical protein